MNMKFKRFLSAVMAMAIVMSMMPVGIAADRAAFVVGDVHAEAGSEVVVPVTVQNNIGFGAVKLFFDLPEGWSISKFKLNDSALLGRSILQFYDEDNESWGSNYNPTPNPAEKSYTIAASVMEDMKKDGVLFYMVVSIPEDYENGDYKIGMSTNGVYHANDAYTDVQNDFDYVSGIVSVSGGIDPEPTTGTIHVDVSGLTHGDVAEVKLYSSYPDKVIGQTQLYGNGRVTYDNLEPGNYPITVECDGYHIYYAFLAVYAGEENEHEVEMTRMPEEEEDPAAFVIGDAVVEPGEEVVVPVYVENNIGFGAVKFFFELPEGLKLEKYKLNDTTMGRSILQYYDEDNESWASNYNPTANVAEKSYTIAASVLDDVTADGVLFYMVLSADTDCAAGEYKIGMSTNGVYHAKDAFTDIRDEFEFCSGSVKVGAEVEQTYYIKGSVEGPTAAETVVVRLLNADFVKIDEMVIGGGDTFKFYDLLPGRYALDVTCQGYDDGFVWLDVVNDNVYHDFKLVKHAEDSAAFVIGDAVVEPGEEVTVPVYVENNIGFGAVKFFFELPEGLKLEKYKLNDTTMGRSILQYYDEDNESWASNYNPTANVAEKSYTIAASVLDDVTADGVLFYMVVSADTDCAAGEYKIGMSTNGVYHAKDAFTDIRDEFEFCSGTVKVEGTEAASGISGWVSGIEPGDVVTVGVYEVFGDKPLMETTVDYYNNSFKFNGLEHGSYAVYANADGYHEWCAYPQVYVGEYTEIEIFMNKIPETGKIYGEINGVGGNGVHVKLLDNDGEFVVENWFYDGWYEFDGLTVGDYTIVATVSGYEEYRNTVAVPVGEIKHSFTMIEKVVTVKIEGTIGGISTTDSVLVELKSTDGLTQLSHVVNNGQYRFEGLKPGIYNLTAYCTGYETYSKKVVIMDDISHDFEMIKKAAVDYLSMLKLNGADVVINNGLSTEVTVTLEATDAMDIYAFEGFWNVEDPDGEGYLTLKSITSDVLNLTGENKPNIETGNVVWLDPNFGETPAHVEKGTKLLTATYVVSGNTPEGKYAVNFSDTVLCVLVDGEENWNEGAVYSAAVQVTRVGDPAPLTQVGGQISGVTAADKVAVELWQNGVCKATMDVEGNGTYFFIMLEPGTYTLKASAEGYKEYSEVITLGTAAGVQNIVMEKKADITEGYPGLLELQNTQVTLNDGQSGTATVVFKATDKMRIAAIEGGWSTAAAEDTGIDLREIVSSIFSFTGDNSANPDDGWTVWLDSGVGDTPVEAVEGTELMAATYFIPAGTPEGTYTVSFDMSMLWTFEDGEDSGDDGIWWEDSTVYTATITVKHHTHVAGVAVAENTVAATCENPGSYEEVVYCADAACGEELSRKTVSVPALGHIWGETTYKWSEDGKACTATRICERDASHVETAEASITSEVKKEPTCEAMGETIYIAGFNNTWAAVQTKTVQDIPALGHAWGAATYNFAADGSACTATRVCERDASHVETATATVTSVVTKPAACEVKGETTYTATFTEDWAAEQTKVIEIPALGHTYAQDYKINCTVCGETHADAIVTDFEVVGDIEVTKENIKYSTTDRILTFSHTVACKVGYLDGTAYKTIKATANPDGSYSFAIPEGVTDLLVVVKGDTSGDGKVNIKDRADVAKHVAKKTTLTGTALFAADVSGDDKVNIKDRADVAKQVAKKGNIVW